MEVKVSPRSDKMLWVLIALLIAAGIVANSYFNELAWTLRLVGWIVLSGGLIALASISSQGKKFLVFFKEAKIELRKVIWPTRDETVKMTMIVAALVVVMALILWGVDSFLLWAVGLIMGQHG